MQSPLMENKQVSQIPLVYLLEKISRVLVPLVFVRVFAMQENSKGSSLQ
jgi:cadmium resistance protein CadD (predicted permease)